MVVLQQGREVLLQRRSQASEGEALAGPSLQDLYAARDLHMHRLSDTDLQAEYLWYTEHYLSESTSSEIRGTPDR